MLRKSIPSTAFKNIIVAFRKKISPPEEKSTEAEISKGN
jgi:hypothetical protein